MLYKFLSANLTKHLLIVVFTGVFNRKELVSNSIKCLG